MGDPLFFALVTGLVSGLLTAVAIFFFREVWVKTISPWYAKYLYKGVDVSGDWEATLDLVNGEQPSFNKHRIKVTQVGYSVKGHADCIDGYAKGQSYVFNGELRNLTLSCIYSSNDPTRIENGAFSLMLKDDGRSLEGCLSLLDDMQNRIISYSLKWNRVNK
jgi:hypothetical protein